ncbi:serine protease [Roseibium denhamense]|uniref:Trypsin-like peptidase domain-containing protein n=1 Tax=Roseibium denhamense TaxID=76305 RepID=A0ABY1NUV9_9HYPH|nr:serine protease [Roseibium denhamense]MTI04834.1 serine protease [Roseibium denhamense]SMP18931.1 Trypsin-like peptidase domain-containing protein [Roseibium denhamense]
MIETLLFTAARIQTLSQSQVLTNATGFFYKRDDRLFLVSSRHVFIDEANQHFPDSLQIELHTSADNVAQTVSFLIPLYRDGRSLWRQGMDSGGQIDVALIELDRHFLPVPCILHAFSEAHLINPSVSQPEVGEPLLIPGYPLGFSDTLHALPVVRHAIIASSFGMRFQGQGYFLTDARTHRGSSGAPVLMRSPNGHVGDGELNCYLLGIHSARLDVVTRDVTVDEALGLNCAWYADILITLTDETSPSLKGSG